MYKMNFTLTLIFFFLAITTAAYAATWYVDDDAPNDPGPNNPQISDPSENGYPDHPFDMIQEGIDIASNGDIILVLSGTYVESVDFINKDIALRSDTDGDPATIDPDPHNTVIDGDQKPRAVWIQNGQGQDTILEGFTVTNGDGGIICINSSPTIKNNLITFNNLTYSDYGAGIFCYNSNSDIISNTITKNNSLHNGGGIYCELSNPTISKNIIAFNTSGNAGGIDCNYSSSPLINNNIIFGNSAASGNTGGIKCNNFSSPQIISNIIAGNFGGSGGGGITCFESSATLIWGVTFSLRRSRRPFQFSVVRPERIPPI